MTTTQPTTACPPWCADAHDDPAELTDSVHLGRPHAFTAEADEVEVRLQLRRWDTRPTDTRPGHVGAVDALLTLVGPWERLDGGPLSADVVLTATDLRALARRCDRLADLAGGAR